MHTIDSGNQRGRSELSEVTGGILLGLLALAIGACVVGGNPISDWMKNNLHAPCN